MAKLRLITTTSCKDYVEQLHSSFEEGFIPYHRLATKEGTDAESEFLMKLGFEVVIIKFPDSFFTILFKNERYSLEKIRKAIRKEAHLGF